MYTTRQTGKRVLRLGFSVVIMKRSTDHCPLVESVGNPNTQCLPFFFLFKKKCPDGSHQPASHRNARRRHWIRLPAVECGIISRNSD